ncbi:MAG: zinc-ribbon domain-containing protein [Bacillota bacterium]|jgi:uncharacterized OB-fold protein|nr:zinc-ribbon domain-containing protein [Bacillota bacterium]MDY0118155.1 zinc-ribbon domain-containing protein [Bacilli bacterium]HOF65438.1 zinc-ribbon domain-containing protein [Bacilli bacterium]
MFCPNCGKEILDPVTSCPHCNEKIVENVEVEVITNTTQKPVKKSKRRYLALVFGVISIFFGIPFGIASLIITKVDPVQEELLAARVSAIIGIIAQSLLLVITIIEMIEKAQQALEEASSLLHLIL